MSEIITPPMVEQRIFDAANEIAKGIRVRAELRAKVFEAKRVFDVKYAMAFKEATGSMELRKQEAVIRTVKERHAYDDAEIAYKYAESRGKALEAELSAMQSIASSVRETFRTAGVGER